jgi:hypothetical protein
MIVREPKSDFEAAPEGLWPGVCVDEIDLGEVTTPWGPKPMVQLVWQLETRDSKGRRHQVRQRYTASLHVKAKLRAMLEGWRGRRFTQEELDGFDLEKVVGACCQLQVVHDVTAEGKVYANLQSIVPYPSGVTKITPEDYVRVGDRAEEKDEADEDDPFSEVPF